MATVSRAAQTSPGDALTVRFGTVAEVALRHGCCLARCAVRLRGERGLR